MMSENAIIKKAEPVSKRNWICWAIMVVLPAIILMLPTSEIFTRDVRMFAAVTLCGILWFAFEVTNFFIPAILLPIGYVLGKVATPADVFAPWFSNLPWMMLAALMIVNIVDRIGLLERAAYFVLSKTGGTYRSLLYGLMLVGLLFNLFLPGIVYIILIPLAYGICKTLNLGHSKTAVGIMFAAMMAANMPSFIVYNPAFLGLALGVTGVSVGWIECLWQNIIFIPMCFLMILVLEKLYQSDTIFQGKAYFMEKASSFGKMSRDEKWSIVLLLVFMLGLLTSGIHKINIGWIFVMIAVAFYLPMFNIGMEQDIKRINFPLVVFITSCMSIGQVSGVLDIGNIIANIVIPLMGNVTPTIFILITWLLAVVLNLLLTPLAAIAAFTVPLVQIATQFGVDPVPVIYTFIQGLDQVFMPYEFANYLFMFSFGVVNIKQFISFFSVKMLVNIGYILLVAVPFWKIIGVM